MEDEKEHIGLVRANLLYKKGEHEQALQLVDSLLREYPGEPEATLLRDRILAARANVGEQDKEGDERRRSLRYTLRMDTAWRRLGWGVGSIVIGIYCLWHLVGAIDQGTHLGFATLITTMQYSRGGSYPYTRPIYVDLITNSLGFVLSAVAGITLFIVSRGAADWEELNASEIESGNKIFRF